MNEVLFDQDDKVAVHEEGAIKLICKAFTSHEAGLPEWIKNSSDMYARRNAAPDESVIVVLLRDAKAAAASAIVGCLDFGGMTTQDIETRFRQWADPNASAGGEKVEGGHGNGGKCYMAQLFSSHALIHTVQAGRGNRYGFKAGSFVPGYFPSKTEGRGFAVNDTKSELSAALKPFGISVTDLPTTAQAAFAKSNNFTLVAGVGAKHLNKGKIPAAKWVEALEGHQQMIRSIERNGIYVLHNGKVLTNADPLALPAIPTMAGAEAPRVIPIPDMLIDPKGEQEIVTGAKAGLSRLVLRTSEVSMRWSLKGRHTINGWTHDERSTGYWEVPSLTKVAYSEKIYGDIYLDALAEYKQNDRRNHSEAPLTRALQQWIANQIEEYASEFVKLDKLQSSEEEKNDLSRLNEQLNNWKNKFLQEQFGGLGTTGSGGSGGSGRKPLPKGEVANVRLSASHAYAGRGVSFRPTVEFFDKSGQRVRAIPHVWSSSDWAVATIDNELNTVTTHKPGTVEITVSCKDSGVHSNVLALEVLDISSIALSPLQMEVHAGSRGPVSAVCNVADGRTIEGVYLIWTEDDSTVAQVGASGMVFGFVPGTTAVTAGDSSVEADQPATVAVLDPKEKQNDGKGGGFPRILLSEVDIDPLGEAPPIFSAAEPPVHQRPQDFDHNIWWINMASPLARRYIDTAKGGGAHSREWRVYLLERYIEIMVKIILTYSFMHGDDISFETMLRRWDEESVAMQERAFESLQGFLEGGEVEPTEMKAAA